MRTAKPSSVHENQWEDPNPDLEMLLWRMFKRTHDNNSKLKLGHVSLRTCPPSPSGNLMKIEGGFHEQGFGAILQQTNTVYYSVEWKVRNPRILEDWLTYARLKYDDLVPECPRIGTGTLDDRYKFANAWNSPYGIDLSTASLPDFYDWMQCNLTQEYIDFLIDIEEGGSDSQHACSFLFLNTRCTGLRTNRDRSATFAHSARHLMLTSPAILVAANMLIFSELKCRGLIVVGCDQDDKNLGYRRHPCLSDADIHECQDRLRSYIRETLGDKWPIFLKRMDWSHPPRPTFSEDRDGRQKLLLPRKENLVDIFDA